MGNNPINLIDPDGGMTDPPKNGKVGEKFNDPDHGMLTYNGNYWVDDSGQAILNEVVVTGKFKMDLMAYVVVYGGSSHSFLMDPETMDYWEASHPFDENGEVINGGVNWVGGDDKSIIRKRNLKDEDFWTFDSSGKKRGNLGVYLIKVSNKQKVIDYANGSVGTYPYHFLANNCKTFVVNALKKGHANISVTNPVPAYPTDKDGKPLTTLISPIPVSNPIK